MSYLTEAFKQMELLESEQFTFDKDGAAKLANFLDDDMLNDFEAIIDPEAETKEEIKDSYMGDVICRCCVCKSLIYKDPEDINIDEEAQLVNIDEECPYCFETGGYEIIGQVAPYEEISVEGADKGTKVEVDGQEVETTTTEESDEEDEDEVLEEGLINEGNLNTNGAKNDSVKDDAKRIFDFLNGRYNVEIIDGNKIHVLDSTQNEEDKLAVLEFDFEADVKSEKLKDGTFAYIIIRDGQSNDQKIKVEEDLSNLDKLYKAYPELKDSSMGRGRAKRHTRDNEDIEDCQRFPVEGTKQIDLKEDLDEESEEDDKETNMKVLGAKAKRHAKDNEDLEDSQRYPIESPAPAQTGLREAMEDISITTDDQVIKVKATPRADKETIQPIEDETKDMIEAPAEEEIVAEEGDEEVVSTDNEETVDLEEVDEESLDTLGESYLKNVYENVNSFKTSSVKNLNNQMIIEGIISFNSGKKCKTKFIFEAKEATKSGKLKFSGLNENITKNKKAFTLTGSIKDKKLMLESLNYNYSAKAENGKSKRLYGTVRI